MKINKSGTITPAILVITGAFIIVIYGLLLLLAQLFTFSNRQTASEKALHIAEAGVNYYRWHLAHEPEDFQDGTGASGPYVHEYLDPEGKSVGYYSLDVTPPADGSSIVTITATGWSNSYPEIKRTIEARYGRPSFAKYSSLQNASGWYGENITVQGDVHSNNGIRMDGTNLALVQSSKETYICGSETGCNPPRYRPGVWGSGGDQSLWQYPVPPVDFNAVSFDFAQMRQSAQNDGLYLANSNRSGYHLTFNSNGTVRVRRVNSTNNYIGYDADSGCQYLPQIIRSETNIGTYNVSDIPIIFAEDHLWIEGTVNGRITVVAARFPVSSYDTNVWINGNITYTQYDGSDSLGLIAQNDIYFIRNLPENFQIDAALMAQTGKIIRHGYFSGCGASSEAIKDSLTINGSVISYGKSYWNFNDPPVSGFITRQINYDTNLLYAPPPFFPTSGEYEFISWKEE